MLSVAAAEGESEATPRGRGSLSALVVAAALALALVGAYRRAWVCDDAFISFRYAQNLVRGLGLVYNAGERVEGYSNLLWTLLMALGLKLGVDVERWSILWGLAFFGGTLALLLLAQRSRSAAVPEWGLPLPTALLLAAAHVDLLVHATSGLETSSYTFLVLAGYLAVTSARPRAEVTAGLLYALAALTRPDGVLFAVLGLGFLVWTSRPRWGPALRFAGAFLLVWLPVTVWRILYYGDYFPNTYYAKSANLAWYSQGWIYVQLYFERYWVLLAALLAGVAASLTVLARGENRPADAVRRRLAGAMVLAAVMSAVYITYIMRVGGDFMFGRMLVPVTPLLLLLGEFGLAVLAPGRRAAQVAVTLAAVLGMALTPSPVGGRHWVSGVADEWDYYTNYRRTWAGRREGAILKRYFEGLPVGMAFIGSGARLVYYADPVVAVESETGLTDATVARRPLPKRGRVGHEKHAPAEYLIETRRLDFAFDPAAGARLDLDTYIPDVPIVFDGVVLRMLRWDPDLLGVLKARGARFPDMGAALDAHVDSLSRLTDEQVALDYARLRRFYFDHLNDPEREAPFLARLGKAVR